MAYYFKLPLVTDLTPEQQLALDELGAISISGGAGTGKTVVSLWRHLNNIQLLNKYSVLVTYTKTLDFYIRASLDSMEDKEEHKEPLSSYVYSLKTLPIGRKFEGKWKVSEIIIDEAQDLEYNKLQEIAKYGDLISYGADFNQQLYENRVTENGIEELFPNNESYNLQLIFRNSYHVLNFVKSVLPDFSINQDSLNLLLKGNQLNIKPHIGIKPKLFITDCNDNQINKMIEIINSFKSDTHNIAVLLPFGDYSEESVENYHKLLSDRDINCSKYYNKMNTDNIKIFNVHVTTYKSVKGLEFDTVIVPFMDRFKEYTQKDVFPHVVNEEDYYVAFTRAKSNLYLFSNQELGFISEDLCDIERVSNFALSLEEEIPF